VATFLQLCQQTRREAGLPGAGPTAVTGQSGMYEKIVGWVQTSYSEVLKMEVWTFLWARATTTLVNGTALYATLPGITDLGRIWRYSVKDTTSAGAPKLTFIDFDAIDRLPATSGPPRYFARRPDDKIVFWPTPDAGYVLQLDYQREGHQLAAGGDTPLIPDAMLHEVIAFKALQHYALHDENQAALAHGERVFWQRITEMCDKYAKKIITQPRPLDQPEDAITSELV